MQIYGWQHHLLFVQSLLRTNSAVAFSITCYIKHVSRLSRLLKSPSTGTVLAAKYKTFDEMLENHSDVPLLIDFYSPFCGPCKLMKDELTKIRPVLDKMGPLVSTSNNVNEDEDCNVANAFQSSDCLDDLQSNNSSNSSDIIQKYGKSEADETKIPSGVPIFHVNANKFPQVGVRNKIHGLPTLVLFLKGVEVWRFEGIMSGEDILQSISKELETRCDMLVPEEAITNDLRKEAKQ
ncbi:hypothetical protein ACHAXN_005751 [Cyclotella atomus]